jgi:hypothetical protein
MMAAIFNFAVPVERLSVMTRTNMAFDLILGALEIAATNMQWLFQSPYSVSALLKYKSLTLDVIDPDTMIALDRLTSVGRQICVPAANDDTGDASEYRFASDVRLYRLAIAQVRYSFAEDTEDSIKGYCLSLITVAGRDFATEIKKQEPMALFIVMYFSVLLDRIARDSRVCWVGSAGKDLVREISDILQRSPIAQIPDGRDGIAWTRGQVGLPAFVFEAVQYLPGPLYGI